MAMYCDRCREKHDSVSFNGGRKLCWSCEHAKDEAPYQAAADKARAAYDDAHMDDYKFADGDL